MKDSNKSIYGQKVEYVIESNGYTIYLGGKPWIQQLDDYGKLYVPDGSYEENCLAHIKELCSSYDPEPTAEEKLRADIDYIAAITGVKLV